MTGHLDNCERREAMDGNQDGNHDAQTAGAPLRPVHAGPRKAAR